MSSVIISDKQSVYYNFIFVLWQTFALISFPPYGLILVGLPRPLLPFRILLYIRMYVGHRPLAGTIYSCQN